MKKRKTWKHCLVLLLIVLTAEVLLQPLHAAESRCGIWCPDCARWQESFKSEVKGATVNVEIIVSCAECERKLISVKRWVETATYNSGTDEESSSWWRHYEVTKLDSAAEFPEAKAYLDGASDSDENSYRVAADGDVFGASGYGWTTQEIFEEAEGYLDALHASLYNCVKASADGTFTWEDWYSCGLSITQTGDKSSALIAYMSKFGLHAVLQEDMVLPVLSVAGDASVQVYRDGAFVTGEMKAGDRVEIIPVKKPGREYADYALTGNVTDIAWDNEEQKLCFTMPAEDVSVEIFFREVQGLEAELNAAFYEKYRKEPYWDGVSFNLDCEPPITVEKNMLTVKAVLVHTGSGAAEKRLQTEFTIEGDNRIINLGENTIFVKADVLGDGYEVQGKCVLKADSVSLKELMDTTGSQTYTELKEFVMNLTERLRECERMIEELSQSLLLSEEQRAEAERQLSAALTELEDVKARLELSREQLAAVSAELEERTKELEASAAELEKRTEELAAKSEELASLQEQLALTEERFAAASEELAGMKEKLTAMQEFMQEMTGSEQIDADALEKLRESFQELKKQKESLSDELERVKEESGKLITQNGDLGTEREKLLRENERLRSSNEEFSRQLKYTIEEQRALLEEYRVLQGKYDALAGEKAGEKQQYLQKLEQLEGKIVQIENERQALAAQLTDKEAERKKLSDEWKQEKTELTALLEAERERAARLEAERKSEANMGTEKEETEADTGEESGTMEENTVIRLETVTEPEKITETMPAETGIETGIETVTVAETVTATEAMTSTEQTGAEAKHQGFRIGVARRVLPSVIIVLLAMLLGGLVLYAALEKKEQKEKKVLI